MSTGQPKAAAQKRAASSMSSTLQSICIEHRREWCIEDLFGKQHVSRADTPSALLPQAGLCNPACSPFIKAKTLDSGSPLRGVRNDEQRSPASKLLLVHHLHALRAEFAVLVPRRPLL